MVYRLAIVLACLLFVGYRLALARAVRSARRAGDRDLERRLRSRGFGLSRWALAAVALVLLLFSLLVWRNGG